MAKIPFPAAFFGMTSVFRLSAPAGLYAYRHVQSLNLLDFPDLADGDLSREQRREALRGMVAARPPLTALSVFLNIVALEDLIREMGSGLARLQWVRGTFPRVDALATRPVQPKPGAPPHARLDTKLFSFLNFKDVNDSYERILGVRPLPDAEFPKLYDLALVRHTVAHHGSVFRAVDAPRFQYYTVVPNTLINPPPDFVRDTATYLYKIGSGFQQAVRRRLFSTIIPTLPTSWRTAPPAELVELVEFFDYLGMLVSSDELPPEHRAVPMDGTGAKEQDVAVRRLLLERALAEVEAESKP